MDMERLYTMKEASKLLGVTVRTIQRWDREGRVRCVGTVGGKGRVPESEIKRILESTRKGRWWVMRGFHLIPRRTT